VPPRSARQKKPTPPASGFKITVDGEVYFYDPEDVSWEHDAELFKALKLTRRDIQAAFASGSYAPFMVAALVFLGRRAAGEQVTFKQVADPINDATEIALEIISEGEADDGPEDPAAD
jgi:hypothetical protein